MSLRLSFLWGILMLPVLVSAQFSPDSAEYLWPTDASNYLSGTFGETRSKHFHAALDIKTWGRAGYDVYATRSGKLHRVAIGPGGYGKAIYLKHDDGSYSVYAHLLSFEDEIQQLADSLRFLDYSNQIDIIVDSLDIRVERGDLIAYSGATGIGPPHLHFELRTPSEKPFNPLLTNLSIEDDMPPQFQGLAVEPLSPHSAIEGEKEILRKPPHRNSNAYNFGTIDVQGPVGLAVDIFDRANRVYNVYAVYDLKLKLDDQLLFHAKVDSFSYRETGQMFLDRIYPVLERTGRAYQRLYVADGNTLSFYKTNGNSGRLNLPEGKHELQILAEDYFGNRSEATVTLNVRSRQPETVYQSNGSYGTNGHSAQRAGREAWQWHKNWIDFNNADSLDYTVVSLDRGINNLAGVHKKDPRSFLRLNKSEITTIQPNRADSIPSPPIQLYRVLPGQRGRAYGDSGKAYATFTKQTVYDTLSVGLSATVLSADSIRIELYPDNQPLQDHFELTYVFDDKQEQDSTFAFYEYQSRKQRLSYIPTQKGGNILKGEAEKLGIYYVLKDTTGPELSNPRIMRRADGTWIARVEAEDARSGINPETAEFYVNGVQGLAEFEPEDDRILYYHPDFSPQDSYTFRVVAEDMMGNRTEREFTINN